jgi:sugar/nucleoside kinase (ribokinase family)
VGVLGTACLERIRRSNGVSFCCLLEEDGERAFKFCGHASADVLIRPEEINKDYIGGAAFLHCGSISLISEARRSTTWQALPHGHGHGL